MHVGWGGIHVTYPPTAGAGGGYTPFYQDFGSATGVTHVLTHAPSPAGTELVTRNLLPMRRAASPVGDNEYSISGATITLAVAKGASEVLEARYTY